MILCELCNEEFQEYNFQKHLIEKHNLLFCQYVGLISKDINLIKTIVEKKPKKTKKQKKIKE